jgi:type VI secretion system protein ImpD/type VI secretion system protein ImpC
MDQEGPQASSLREPVLAGRYFANSPFARELAEWLTLDDTRALLASWFGEAWLGRLASQPAAASGLRAALDRDIAAIDALLSVQLDAVLHHARVRRLEGSWRGLAWLVDRLPPADVFASRS